MPTMSLQRVPLINYSSGICLYVLKEKFRTMKFYNLSPKTDFNSKFQSDFEILMNNILYMTHELDQVKKIVTEIKNSSNLQKQVDEYFEETSPQTDSVEQKDASR